MRRSKGHSFGDTREQRREEREQLGSEGREVGRKHDREVAEMLGQLEGWICGRGKGYLTREATKILIRANCHRIMR